MFQISLAILAFFGGLIFFALDCLAFKLNTSNIRKVFMFFIALIPCVGAITYISMFIYGIFNYKTNGFGYTGDDDFIVRDTKINRYLFNDVNWENYDKYLNKKPQQEQQEQ